MRFPWQQKRDIEFIDSSRKIYQHYPIMRAKDVKCNSFDSQKEKHGAYKFPLCPGLFDYSQLGYIVPAWVDIHIMANKAGTNAALGSQIRGDRGFSPPSNMSTDIVDGIINLEDDIPLGVIKFDCPWKIFGHGNISALLLPAVYHSTFLDDIHVWSGIVDYKKFHVSNFIISAKRKCSVHIKAGEPLLHIIPLWNKDMLAGYGPGTDIQIDATKNEIPGETKQYYRKHYMINKIYKLLRK